MNIQQQQVHAGFAGWYEAWRSYENEMSFAVILLFLGFLSCEAFNIDTSVPIVKLGLPESYFGYSVSPHYIRTGTTVRPV